MKNLALGILLSLTSLSAGTVALSVGVGTETITKPSKIDVKLIEERVMYQFDNGILAGIGRMDGTPDVGLAQIRNDVILGYGTRYGILVPFVTIAKGELIMGGNSYNSTTSTIGSGILLNNNISTTIQYRHRHDKDIEWITDRYQVGVTYNFTKNFNTSVSYGKSYGTFRGRDYESTQLGLLGTYKF
jgi:hypothetical protein